MIGVDGFDWDGGNRFKSEAKHGVSREEVEALFMGEVWVSPDPKHSARELRYLAIGTSVKGRSMIVAFTLREMSGLRLIRPISARYMHKNEAKKYVQAFTKDDN